MLSVPAAERPRASIVVVTWNALPWSRRALESIVELPDPELGHIKMQNVLFRLSETPGTIRWTGRRIGQDNEQAYGELGLSPEEIASLREKNII